MHDLTIFHKVVVAAVTASEGKNIVADALLPK